eukprot:scaffold62295_cov33-Prasinocladus_malaysianus.AAC.2
MIACIFAPTVSVGSVRGHYCTFWVLVYTMSGGLLVSGAYGQQDGMLTMRQLALDGARQGFAGGIAMCWIFSTFWVMPIY